jgi:hypothetical protein
MMATRPSGEMGTRLAQPIMGAPSQVAKVIAGALSGFTRPRYLVGYDARRDLAVVTSHAYRDQGPAQPARARSVSRSFAVTTK